ncbi:MAG: 30S ribosomal protein S8 [Pseudanabaenaceae cyanobacterium]
MAVNDTIADMLTRIRNASIAKQETVTVPVTRMTSSIAKVLKQEGYIAEVEEVGTGVDRRLVLYLKYQGRHKQPIINMLRRVSRPGLRVYSNHRDLPKVLGGIGIAIISTSRGIMTDREARRQKVGGEILCYIW